MESVIKTSLENKIRLTSAYYANRIQQYANIVTVLILNISNLVLTKFFRDPPPPSPIPAPPYAMHWR